jgi:hypothetical protein
MCVCVKYTATYTYCNKNDDCYVPHPLQVIIRIILLFGAIHVQKWRHNTRQYINGRHFK